MGAFCLSHGAKGLLCSIREEGEEPTLRYFIFSEDESKMETHIAMHSLKSRIEGGYKGYVKVMSDGGGFLYFELDENLGRKIPRARGKAEAGLKVVEKESPTTMMTCLVKCWKGKPGPDEEVYLFLVSRWYSEPYIPSYVDEVEVAEVILAALPKKRSHQIHVVQSQ